MNCPFGFKVPPCSLCMYQGPTGCLNGKGLSVDEFARARGISHVQADNVRQKAEARIQAGLCGVEYLSWWKNTRKSTSARTVAVAEEVLKDVPELRQLGFTPIALAEMARMDTWQAFRSEMNIEIEISLHEVLLINTWQLEELSQD